MLRCTLSVACRDAAEIAVWLFVAFIILSLLAESLVTMILTRIERLSEVVLLSLK